MRILAIWYCKKSCHNKNNPLTVTWLAVDMRTQMLDKDTNAWRRMIIDVRPRQESALFSRSARA